MTYLLLSAEVLLAQTPKSQSSPTWVDPLFASIWRITSATPYPHSGSIYVFLRNGTLLETSCVETYRVATWKADPKKPGTFEITEDGRLAFTASIVSVTSRALKIKQTLALGDRETREVTFEAVNKEFVCPDMPK